MWHWLQKKLPRRFILLAQLGLVATGLHSFLLLMVFVVYRGQSYTYMIEISKHLNTEAEIVFLPFQKRVQNKKATGGRRGQKQRIATVQEKKEAPTKQAQPKESKATTIAAACKPEKKVVKNERKVPKVHQKVTKADKEKLKKEAEKKVDPPKEDKPVEQKVEQPVEAAKADLVSTATAVKTESTEGADVQYAGQHDLDALRMQEYINGQIGAHWSPPVGVAKECECHISLLVDWHGKIQNMKITKSSGVLIYDISARKAMSAMEMPKWLYGKEITIAFKQ